MLDRPLELPPEITHKRIRAAAAEYARLLGEHQASSTAAHGLEQARHEAVEVDRRAYADALRAGKGKDDPGQPATERADAEILKTRRREEALAVAVAAARTDLIDAVDQHRDEWAAALQKQLEGARDKLREAVDQVSAAHADLAEAHAGVSWLEAFPEQSLWRPGRFAAQLPALRTPSGDAVPTAAAIAALRELAEPPAEPAQPAEPRRFSGSEQRWVPADAA